MFWQNRQKKGTCSLCDCKYPLNFHLQDVLALNPCSERHEGKRCDLEILFSPRNSDNSYAQNDSDECIADCHLDPAEDDPQDVEQERNCVFIIINDLFAKRVKRNACQFKTLQTDRNANYGDAP